MRRETLLTKLNLHIAALAFLLVFDLVVATRLVIAWHQSHSDESAQYAADRAAYSELMLRSARLRDLPTQLRASNLQLQQFLQERIPADDSAVVAELGALKNATHVNLSQAHYALRPALPGLAEVQIEAALSGQYVDIMHFINGLERDKNHAFFTIRAITLTDQQGGLVNLRLVLTTYMRSDATVNNALSTGERGPAQGGQ